MSSNTLPHPRHGDPTVVTLVVTMTIVPEHEQDFLAVCREAAARVHAEEPGALLYALTKHPTAPHTYVWVERYRDAAALAQHRAAPYIAEAIAKIRPWWAKTPDGMQLAQVIPAP